MCHGQNMVDVGYGPSIPCHRNPQGTHGIAPLLKDSQQVLATWQDLLAELLVKKMAGAERVKQLMWVWINTY